MLLFSTLLPIADSLNEENFMELVQEWNQGSKYKENIVQEVAWNGEDSVKFGRDGLTLEVVRFPKEQILAVRHEKITSDLVVWDTDYVVNFRERKIAIRLDRTYREDAVLMDGAFSTPHFISLLIEKGYLKEDVNLPVLRTPMSIADEKQEFLKNVINRRELYQLPIVYVTKTQEGEEPLSISWLASRLKGAAHVLVEEGPEVCEKCREFLDETEEPFGAVKVYFPMEGMDRKRFLFRSNTGNREQRLEKVIRCVIQYRNAQHLEALYTWQGVNNGILMESLHSQIKKCAEAEHAKMSAEEEINQVYEAFDDDLKKMQKKLDELTKANEMLQMENLGLRARINTNEALPLIFQGDEEDYYDDEIKDMLLGCLLETMQNTETNTRRHDVLLDILENNPYKHLSEERRQRVKALFKGYKNLSGAMRQELLSMGFQITEDGKHYKVTYKDDARYMVTIGKTPSDNRAGSNNAALINKMML